YTHIPTHYTLSLHALFRSDGIVDVTKWNVAKPKTMFLLKETYADPEEWEPCWGITSNANTFSLNIARWHSVLRTLFKEPSAVRKDRKSTRLNSSHVAISYA